jgi:hypothetical protein
MCAYCLRINEKMNEMCKDPEGWRIKKSVIETQSESDQEVKEKILLELGISDEAAKKPAQAESLG